jgi:hypothetical protein
MKPSAANLFFFLSPLLLVSLSCGTDYGGSVFVEPVCGNAVIENPEACDLGYPQNGQAGSTCSSACTYQQPTVISTPPPPTIGIASQCCLNTVTRQFGSCKTNCVLGVRCLIVPGTCF